MLPPSHGACHSKHSLVGHVGAHDILTSPALEKLSQGEVDLAAPQMPELVIHQYSAIKFQQLAMTGQIVWMQRCKRKKTFERPDNPTTSIQITLPLNYTHLHTHMPERN